MNELNLQELFGVEVPDFAEIDERIDEFTRRLENDPEQVFVKALGPRERARRSIPAATMVAEFMMRDCVAAGRVDDDGVYLVFLHVLYILVIDDHVDVELSPTETSATELSAYMDAMQQACRTATQCPDDEIARYIWTLTNRLRAYPAFSAFADLYFQCLANMLEGMVQEFRLRGDPTLNLDNYMESARMSTGSNLGLTAALIILGDTGLAAQRDRIDVVYDIVASIVRYANDIRTYERELSEGNITSLQLAAKKFGIPTDRFRFNLHDVIRIVRALMLTDVYDLRDCLEYVDSEDGLFNTVLVHAVLGVVSLYEKADFHTLGIRGDVTLHGEGAAGQLDAPPH